MLLVNLLHKVKHQQEIRSQTRGRLSRSAENQDARISSVNKNSIHEAWLGWSMLRLLISVIAMEHHVTARWNNRPGN